MLQHYGCTCRGNCSSLHHIPSWTRNCSDTALGVQANVRQCHNLLALYRPCETLADTVSTYQALEPLIAAGKARAIGVSNFNASFLQEFLAQDGVSIHPAVDQCGFSIHGHGGNNGAETPLGRDTATLQGCRAHNVTYSAYSPLGGLSHINLFGNPEVCSMHCRSTQRVVCAPSGGRCYIVCDAILLCESRLVNVVLYSK